MDKDWEMTVFPQPKAPGIAVVPPWTQLLLKYNVSLQLLNVKKKEIKYGKRASNTR